MEVDPIFHSIRLVPRRDRTSTYTMKQQQDQVRPYLRFDHEAAASRSECVVAIAARGEGRVQLTLKQQAHPENFPVDAAAVDPQ
jgi:hypothetical protein